MSIAESFTADGPVIPHYGSSSGCVKDNGIFCGGWLTDHWGSIFWPALLQHIELTLVAVAIGFIIAFSCAVLAHQKKWLTTPFTIVGSIFYTIPALALFQILLPITGITTVTVEVALVTYTLLILFRNISTGLDEVPDDVRDAAIGMGLTPLQLLVRIELPLALPAIIAGVRIAMVTVVSLATVAAFIIDEGLGAPIFDAIKRGNFKTEFVAAGVMAIALALGLDGLLLGVQRTLTPWTRRRPSSSADANPSARANVSRNNQMRREGASR